MKKFLIWVLTSMYPEVCVFERTSKNSMYADADGNMWQCFCRKKKSK